MTTDEARRFLRIMFHDHMKVMTAAYERTREGDSAAKVAAEHIQPIIVDLSEAAGQEMDATYIAYLIQYSLLE